MGSFTAIFSGTGYVVIVMDVSLVTRSISAMIDGSVYRLDPDPRHADLSHHTRYAVDYLHTHDEAPAFIQYAEIQASRSVVELWDTRGRGIQAKNRLSYCSTTHQYISYRELGKRSSSCTTY